MKKIIDKIAAMDSAWFLVMIYVVIILLGCCNLSHGQSKCDKPKNFMAEMKIETGPGIPSLSISAGATGNYGNGSLLDNFSATAGIKWYKATKQDKTGNDVLVPMPIFTTMYRVRASGDDSKFVHGIAIVSGYGTADPYYSVEYRLFRPAKMNDFATIGGAIGWNTAIGFTIGFVAAGFF